MANRSNNTTTSFRIGELANEFNITTRTIRHYEERGLINPDRRGKQRIYSAADRVVLMLILRGKRLGLSLDQSAELIAMYEPANNKPQLDALLQRISQQRALLQQQLADIAAVQQELDQAEARCLKAQQALLN